MGDTQKSPWRTSGRAHGGRAIRGRAHGGRAVRRKAHDRRAHGGRAIRGRTHVGWAIRAHGGRAHGKRANDGRAQGGRAHTRPSPSPPSPSKPIASETIAAEPIATELIAAKPIAAGRTHRRRAHRRRTIHDRIYPLPPKYTAPNPLRLTKATRTIERDLPIRNRRNGTKRKAGGTDGLQVGCISAASGAWVVKMVWWHGDDCAIHFI